MGIRRRGEGPKVHEGDEFTEGKSGRLPHKAFLLGNLCVGMQGTDDSAKNQRGEAEIEKNDIGRCFLADLISDNAPSAEDTTPDTSDPDGNRDEAEGLVDWGKTKDVSSICNVDHFWNEANRKFEEHYHTERDGENGLALR